jgi:hypothetical protein
MIMEEEEEEAKKKEKVLIHFSIMRTANNNKFPEQN